MDASQINVLRTSLISIMDEVHRVCEDNNIPYYIIGGTALGAVRHKGFIPWDTDIDIAMRREDYDRFVSICNQKINTEYFCAHYGNTEKWYHPHALVFKKTTQIIWNREYYRSKEDCPIYIDIFPLDKVPSDKEKMRKQEKRIRRKMYLQSRRECVVYQRNNAFVRLLKKMYSAILRIRSNASFNLSLDRTMSLYKSEKSTYLCSMASHYSYEKQCMLEAIYGTPKKYEFEGRAYYGPEKIEQYLSQLFGDYMELPPVEKQKENMDYIGQIIVGI